MLVQEDDELLDFIVYSPIRIHVMDEPDMEYDDSNITILESPANLEASPSSNIF